MIRSSGSAGAPPSREEVRGIAERDEVVAFQVRFLGLLQRQTEIYTIGDSTSVPVHVAADLLRSVCFVLGIDPDEPALPEGLLAADLEREYRRGLAEIGRKVELSGELWRQVCALMPPIPSTSLHDTLQSIGDFPKLYDYRSMAHEMPCVFDYPLCHPVSDALLGVDYINEYLRRLLVEFEFLARFGADASIGVLERTSPDFVELLVNLYEPVATNAIGRALVGEDPLPLLMTPEQRTEAARLLGPLTERQRRRVLEEAAVAVCEAVGLQQPAAREYLLVLVPELLPRIEVALAQELGGVFV